MRQVSIHASVLLAVAISSLVSETAALGQSRRAVRPVRIVPAQTRPAPRKGEPPKNLPVWKDLEKAVKSELAQTKDYRSGDLLTQSDGKRALKAIQKKGWTISSSHKLPERFLSDSDELVQMLKGEEGAKFMRQLANVPGGFDRLDKLQKQPGGSRQIRQLMTQPDGYKLIEYLATTQAGRNTGRQLSTRGRGDFNAPTNRIYTESDLLAALKVIYAGETTSESSRRVR